MADLLFCSSGINGESKVLDVCNEFGAFASGCNLFRFQSEDRVAKPFPDSHQDHIHSVSIASYNGCPYVLTASADKSIKIWSINDLLVTVNHKFGLLNAVAFTNLGKIAAYDEQGNVLIYEKGLDFEFSLKQTLSFGLKKVHSLACSPEGILAVGTSDKQIRIFVEKESKFVQVLTLSGHLNWVTCLDWSPLTDSGVRMLSSCGPDKTIRLWRLSKKGSVKADPRQLLELVPKKCSFAVESGEEYVIENEAIMYGHEGMVNSCLWSKNIKDGDTIEDFRLISSSADHTLIIWAPGASMWNSVAHIGDISGSGTVGADRSFGFFSGIILGERIYSHSSNGAVQFWSKSGRQTDSYSTWESETPLTGHYKSVESCTWDRSGRFLLTSSLDQTTRAFAASKTGLWHEIGRPQIHGYDLHCISMIDEETFMSGADEKVLRVFTMPDSFKIRLNALLSGEKDASEAASMKPTMVPALGLSNKSYGDEDSGPIVAEMPLNQPPTESDLCRHTLWPEIDKLYGHGNELFSLAVNPAGDLAASAARANLSADAGIRFWMRSTSGDSSVHWIAVPGGHIEGHTLTIVDLQFSPSGRYLLATSRDRTWSVIEIVKDAESNYQFRMIQREEGHARIIWSGVWESDSSFFTVSRDKSLKSWKLDEQGKFVLTSSTSLLSGGTAVDISHDSSMMAVGEESGQVTVYKKSGNLSDWKMFTTFKAASDAINDIKWRPGNLNRQLAVVSKDRSVRIFHLHD